MAYREESNLYKNLDGRNLLSTRQDDDFIKKESIWYQWEPAVVLDVILDHNHEIFNLKSKDKSFQSLYYPEDFSGRTSDGSLDYSWVGRVLIRLCYSNSGVSKENLIWAKPIEKTGISEYPLVNELVGVVKYLDGYYYTRKINEKGWVNHSADLSFEQTFGQNNGNREFFKSDDASVIYYRGPESSLAVTKSFQYQGALGRYFVANNRVRSIQRYEGDTVIESRHGQSIRFSAYDDNRNNDVGDYKDYKLNNVTNNLYGVAAGCGNPMILIRNRQRPLAELNAQSLHPKLSPIPSISKSLSERFVNGYIPEDLNNDGSSIHITSGKTISTFRTTCYKSYFGNNLEEQNKFSPEGCSTFVYPTLNKDQIVIHSDRLIFASRFSETMHFSKKRYQIVTDSEYTLDAHDQIVLTTNQKTTINSPLIYLGEYNNANEPVLLGQTTVNWLYELCNWLLEHMHYYDHSHPGTGGPSPDQTQLPVQNPTLAMLQSKLNTLLSRRVFVTGGGFANGNDGGSIQDGKDPKKVDTITGNGVDGGFKGTNFRSL